ncbi:protein ABHD15 [Sphaeramia orbicularis]|uniref:protein ABHD15 n=1 Tax=Sphaeramia orbicularis TaxID=375764 RepID=UPI00117DF3D9|nr:protein ABHD15-like [Sphaeramia orbicularis]
MALFVWQILLCLFPWLLFLLLSVVLRWPVVCSWMEVAVRAAGWRLWMTMCLILQLPLDRNPQTGTKEARPPGTAFKTTGGPRFICKPTTLARYLLRYCGSLARSRLASWPRGDPHLQTLCSLMCGPHEDTLQFTRDHLVLRDGGIVALDWAVGTRLGEGGGRRRSEGRGEKALGCFSSTPPVLLLIPQYWGGMSNHLKALCLLALRQGFYVVVFHPRGTAGCPLTTTRLTEFGDPADLEQAVVYVHSRHPSSALVAVSEGSGSGILLSYLGEKGSSSYLTAAAAISPVLLGQVWFEADMPPIYRWGALFQRKQQLRRYETSFRSILDVDKALSSPSLREFEETFFCAPPYVEGVSASCQGSHLAPSVAWALGERAYPATDWDNYWDRNEPLRDADEVAVPVLCICSWDDPLLPPASTLPLPLFQSSPYFMLLMTERGGHCGFTVEDQQEDRNWSHMVVLDYFKVVADFLKVEERDGGARGSLVGECNPPNNRSTTLTPPQRRRAAMLRRARLQTQNQNCVETGEEFKWKRSYTG